MALNGSFIQRGILLCVGSLWRRSINTQFDARIHRVRAHSEIPSICNMQMIVEIEQDTMRWDPTNVSAFAHELERQHTQTHL